MRIGACEELRWPLIGRQTGRFSGSEIDGHAVEKPPVLPDVIRTQFFIGFFTGFAYTGFCEEFGIAACIFIVFITRRCGNQYCGRVGIRDYNPIILDSCRASARQHPCPDLEPQRSFNSRRFSVDAAEDEGV